MTNRFLLNLFLAGVYVALVGRVTFLDAATGFLIGMLIITMIGRSDRKGGYLHRVWGLFKFGVYFMAVLIKANVQVAREILTPGFSMTPRIVRYPVADLTAIETTTLANAISLTPGTLSADISDDGNTLYVHCMYAESREAAIDDLDELKCWLIREVFDHEL
jgi:multicomponent Na+:H+ antiporter subunit E